MKRILLAIVVALSGCGLPHHQRAGVLGGYAFGERCKEDSILTGFRHVIETPLKDTGLQIGVASSFQFFYTDDAIDNHDYDLREYELSPLLHISYPMTVTPFVEIGPVFRWGEADADAVGFEEIQVDLRIGAEWGGWFLAYRGTNTNYGIDVDTSGGVGRGKKSFSTTSVSHSKPPKHPRVPPGTEMDSVNQWINAAIAGYMWEF